MSVRLMDGSDVYEYRFQIDGIPYRGTTGMRTEREAKLVEREVRRKIEQERSSAALRRHTGDMTVSEAIQAYVSDTMLTKPHLNKGVLRTEAKAFDWIAGQLGADTLMRDIDLEAVRDLVRARRLTPTTNSLGRPLRDANGDLRQPSPAYVNRYTTKLLRRVWIHVRDDKNAAVAPIKWKKVLIAEPEGRQRELLFEEQRQLMSIVDLSDGYGAALQFALLSGFRKAAFTGMKWKQVDFTTGVIVVTEKGGRTRQIRMTAAIRDLLMKQRGHHPRCTRSSAG